jgi:type IV secretory pathway component VirB8
MITALLRAHTREGWVSTILLSQRAPPDLKLTYVVTLFAASGRFTLATKVSSTQSIIPRVLGRYIRKRETLDHSKNHLSTVQLVGSIRVSKRLPSR